MRLASQTGADVWSWIAPGSGGLDSASRRMQGGAAVFKLLLLGRAQFDVRPFAGSYSKRSEWYLSTRMPADSGAAPELTRATRVLPVRSVLLVK